MKVTLNQALEMVTAYCANGIVPFIQGSPGI